MIRGTREKVNTLNCDVLAGVQQNINIEQPDDILTESAYGGDKDE